MMNATAIRSSSPFRMLLAGIIVAACVFLVVVVLAVARHVTADYSQRAYELAYLNCMPSALDRIEGVRFSTFEASTVTHRGNDYTVHGYVDLDEETGTVRHTYTTRLRRDPADGKWTNQGTELSPPL